MKLSFPELNHKENAFYYKQEFFDNNEMHISGDGGLADSLNYEEWISKIQSDLTRDDGTYVPATTFFALVDEKIIGTVQIRHKLNDYLFNYGGHIGYSVVPSQRKKGYATQMLSLALLKCKELHIERVLITCDKDNIGSAKTIINNCGVLENEILRDNKKITQRYWIEI